MAVKEIRKTGDPGLRERSKEVEKIDSKLRKLVKDMTDTMNEMGGVGLAAPQIGVTRRVIIVNIGAKIQAFINPVIKVLDDKKMEGDEGCLSIYSIKGFQVKRFNKIKVKAMDLKGNKITLTAEGLLARIFQHEVDHLNGILYMDHLDKKSKSELLSRISDLKLNIEQ